MKSFAQRLAVVGALAASLTLPLAAQRIDSPDSLAKSSGLLGFRLHYVTGARYPVIDSVLPGSWAALGHMQVGDSLVGVTNMVDFMANKGFANYDWILGGYFAVRVERGTRLLAIGLNGMEDTGTGGGGGGVARAPGDGARGPNGSAGATPPPTKPATPPTASAQPRPPATPRKDALVVLDSLVKAAARRGPIQGTKPTPLFSKGIGTASVEVKGAATINENATTGVLTIYVGGTTITVRPPQ